MRIHIIAMGGAAMHNIALDLQAQGHHVTGSDDEIYEPSLSRLRSVGICPDKLGWFPERITDDIALIILGMHARIDNPELVKAQELGIEIMSYPAFVYHHSQDKKRVVIAGSHGKTTTTAMVLHALQKAHMQFDYLVGAQLDGFDRMVSLTDAPLIIIEGDEYLSSPIDRVPKIHHYRPHIGVLTGIAWDHINVFPTFDIYKKQFEIFLDTFESNGCIIFNATDPEVAELMESTRLRNIPYSQFKRGEGSAIDYDGKNFPIQVIGNHNLQNMEAAAHVCQELGISTDQFLLYMADFKGAAKRLNLVSQNAKRRVYLDFAHAPSKVKATTEAVKDWFGEQLLLAVLELHTFSSLQQDFIPQYRSSLDLADNAVVCYDPHTLAMKNMPPLSKEYLAEMFAHPNLQVFNNIDEMSTFIKQAIFESHNVLMMSSGKFGGMDLSSI